MPEPKSLEKRLQAIEGALEKTLDKNAAIEKRFDSLREELQRTASMVYRLNLAQEANRGHAKTQTDKLYAIFTLLEKIDEKLIGKK